MGDAPMSEHKCGIPIAVLIATELQGAPHLLFQAGQRARLWTTANTWVRQ